MFLTIHQPSVSATARRFPDCCERETINRCPVSQSLLPSLIDEIAELLIVHLPIDQGRLEIVLLLH